MKNVNFDLTIYGLSSNGIPSADAFCLAECFASYSEHCANESILGIGFNSNSGYMYIALENGVTIGSCFGRCVDFIVCDPDTGEEEFFDTYASALDYLNEAYPMSDLSDC